ncbi:rhamnose ABC transporter substrate-binding protein [Marinitenerispora sediminis]|uniref:Rhamnose ABC transporter substrate-binding protein n=1 Tax=Marinitenerispora sediminis TaxID=1931232 RepID=A0A368T902_9ACTN|nr:rhamnose ABC transporter substrate-binding protein [Marinitenerispora sediminis]RCV53536.1 rhamnose ABC transporter substrate-binding protein [Marinitenerispora sediminis]RCV57692.1 rhamnose ABC transporter substrate-binding protein [Marinitenerispora sediminis]RCV60751.1 rhamnose ABC transporter substrate-binding protein [Marinitenerispora sediminis]
MLRSPHRAGLAGALAALLLATACGGGTTRESAEEAGGPEATAVADPDAEIPEGLQVAFLPKQLNNPYFTVADAGGEEAVGEFGGEFKEVGPSEATASSQVSYINTLSQQDNDVIVTAANDPNAVCGALNQARQAGASVVTFDSDTDPECRDVFVNQASAAGIAETLVRLTSERIGGSGQIAILSATPNATNQNAWIELMERELEKEEYAGIELVTIAYGNDDDQKSFQETQGLLRSYPDLAGIISPTTVGVAAAARYLSGSEYRGEVALTGLGTPNQMREFVEDGTVESFALWNPADLGYLAAWAGAALAAGQITGEAGETFEAGRLGEYEVGADGEVVLGPPTVFTADNIDDFDF